MDCIEKVFGAKALIYLKSHLDMQKISAELANGLMLPNFELEPDEYPPHDMSGSCEALGFEIWLEKTNDIKGLSYLLKIETEYSIKESFDDQMYDLSPWLARYVSKICGIESFIPCKDNLSGLLFTNGEATKIDIINLTE